MKTKDEVITAYIDGKLTIREARVLLDKLYGEKLVNKYTHISSKDNINELTATRITSREQEQNRKNYILLLEDTLHKIDDLVFLVKSLKAKQLQFSGNTSTDFMDGYTDGFNDAINDILEILGV